jgi:two-component system, CitB family, response regulator DctR
MRTIDVILIEDDPMVQEVNRQFVQRVEGFRIVGVASSGAEGIELVRRQQPELVFLDIFMPVLDGLQTLRQIRSEALAVDVIVISAANDMTTIQRMLHQGAVDYIIKPFKFERVKQALEHYRSKKEALEPREGSTLSQTELDRLLFGQAGTGKDKTGLYPSLPPAAPDPAALLPDLPKGLQAATLRQIVQYVVQQGTPLSAEEVAEGVGIARVTARRYLDHLEKSGVFRLDLQYGVGRPVNKYVYTGR